MTKPSITKINIEISLGELVDRITILEVKKENIKDQEKLKHAVAELIDLSFILSSVRELDGNNEMQYVDVPDALRNELHDVNADLWDVLDAQRKVSFDKVLGPRFMDLSFRVFQLNDRRFELKRAINEILTNTDQPLEQKEYV